jgi:hypothetical protein
MVYQLRTSLGAQPQAAILDESLTFISATSGRP